MNTISPTSKAVLAGIMLAVVFASGCSRRQSAEGQASSGSNATDATAASRASDAGTSSGASGSPAADASSGTSGTSSSHGTGPATKAGAAIDDSVITTKIKSSILSDAAVRGTDISVETKNGEVTLTGSVKSSAQSDRAQKIAMNTDGVHNVQNKLAVKP